jgi:hypothetical protein
MNPQSIGLTGNTLQIKLYIAIYIVFYLFIYLWSLLCMGDLKMDAQDTRASLLR